MDRLSDSEIEALRAVKRAMHRYFKGKFDHLKPAMAEARARAKARAEARAKAGKTAK